MKLSWRGVILLKSYDGGEGFGLWLKFRPTKNQAYYLYAYFILPIRWEFLWKNEYVFGLHRLRIRPPIFWPTVFTDKVSLILWSPSANAKNSGSHLRHTHRLFLAAAVSWKHFQILANIVNLLRTPLSFPFFYKLPGFILNWRDAIIPADNTYLQTYTGKVKESTLTSEPSWKILLAPCFQVLSSLP